MMTQALIAYFGDSSSAQLDSAQELIGKKRLKAIEQRLHAYLQAIHSETKPLRPGAPSGQTLESAAIIATELSSEIYPPVE
ncbi:hypothetical protein [Rubritalea marina]|uniref:hypothetical protein n=1 Tax=Rubritalea marina TaxID=361055 RepID=UPI0012E9B836|nr:hypothetical protein [Rubritalea marina]